MTFDVDDGRFTARRPPAPPPGDAHAAARASCCPASPTPTRTPSTGRCAAAPTTGGGTFWTWRDRMYAVAARLDPDSYLALARAAYAEMALAGVTAWASSTTCTTARAARPYADPNAMGHALAQAAADAGIRLTLLDTCYLAGGVGRPPGRRACSAGSPTAPPTPGRSGSPRCATAPGAADRRGGRTPCGRCRATALPGRGRARPAGRPAARAPVRAARRERRLPRRATAAPRPGCSPPRACSARPRRRCTPPT